VIPTNRLDLNLLNIFITIYRESSLTRASEILHLTQPAVSHSLARLRDQFDDPLFRRQGNKMVPTPLAQRLANSIHPGLGEIHAALNSFHDFTPEQQPAYSTSRCVMSWKPPSFPADAGHGELPRD